MKLSFFSIILFLVLGFLKLTAQTRSIGLMGTATLGGWETDTDMTQDKSNPDLWTLEIKLETGLLKFRSNHDWSTNWGGSTFPKGDGKQDGDDLLIKAGNYLVTFNSKSGKYQFELINLTNQEELSVNVKHLNEDALIIYPNPTNSIIKIELNDEGLKNDNTIISLYDDLGKIVYSNKLDLNNLTVDTSDLNAGNYHLKVSNNKCIVTKQVSVIK